MPACVSERFSPGGAHTAGPAEPPQRTSFSSQPLDLLRACELDYDLDVVRPAVERLIKVLRSDAASDELLEPGSLGSGQHLRRAVVVPTVCVHGTEEDEVLKHGVGQKRRR